MDTMEKIENNKDDQIIILAAGIDRILTKLIRTCFWISGICVAVGISGILMLNYLR